MLFIVLSAVFLGPSISIHINLLSNLYLPFCAPPSIGEAVSLTQEDR
jgi:hypothetical protein